VAEPARISALQGHLPPGRHGATQGEPGVRLGEVRRAAMAQVHAAHGGAAHAALVAALGLQGEPAPRCAVAGPAARLLWNGPGQFLAVSDAHAGAALARELEQSLAGPGAAAVDLGHARTVFGIDGPASRDLLAKGCPLDVDTLAPGDAGPTVVSHFNVLLHCVADDAFELFVTRSFAAAFADWLLEAGAEFGVAVR